MVKEHPEQDMADFANYIANALTTETPVEEKINRRHTVVRTVNYTPLSSLLAEIGMATEQDEIDAIVHRMRLCD